MPVRNAPAKVNLALCVTGRREDGYHLIDSLVVFAGEGDLIQAEVAKADSFIVTGPFSKDLRADAPSVNLCERARDGMRAMALATGRAAPGVALHLTKNLPVASGLGGGSADAAATLGVLGQLWGFAPAPEALQGLALSLGADVPMCLAGTPLRARGIGEILEPLGGFPPAWLVIVNPGVALSTPQVFGALERRDNPPLHPFPVLADAHALARWLASARNDLEPAALTLVPEIAVCLDSLNGAGALISRMSGSGASCYGLFANAQQAEQAAAAIRKLHPDWFVAAMATLKGASRDPGL